MIIAFLFIIGVVFGSFVNALVWRLRQQIDDDGEPVGKVKGYRVKGKEIRGKKGKSNIKSGEYSILKGRSMCPNCKHVLAWYDLVPVFSWLSLGGKCRYCKKPISWQYPLIELLTGLLFAISYLAWPLGFAQSWAIVSFVGWLLILVGLVALAVYDAKWMLLPNRIIYPLIIITCASLALQFILGRPIKDILPIIGAVVVAGGIFWVLYQVSKGKWVGGGDIKLGILAGLLLTRPTQAFLYLFVASVLGLVYSVPLMLTKRLTTTSKVPFGPFLIASLIIVVLWGAKITDWYGRLLIGN